MKNITLSAEEGTIERAREAARVQHKTLNQLFREWLEELGARQNRVREFDALMEDMRKAGVGSGGRRFTRKEMNER